MEAVAPYRITGRLGGGRNTHVLAAENLGAICAIKLFSPSKQRRQRLMRRGRADPLDQWRTDFEREVDLQNSVQHPAIVTILNRAQTNDGNPYFVMPLYPETLAIRRWGTNLP